MEGVSLTLNGRPCPVRECRVSGIPFNRVWPGRQRPYSQSESAGYVLFSGDEPVTVTIELEAVADHPVVRPLSARIACSRDGRKVSFTLPGPGQYVFENGSQHHALHFFYDPVCDYADRDGARWYFGPGIHCPGVIHVESGDTVYIDAEAIVYGAVSGDGVENVKVIGGGVLDCSWEERIFADCVNYVNSNMKFIQSRSIFISGVTLLNASCWTLMCFGCSDVVIDRIKIVGQWRYNTDGIDLCNTDHARILNSFVRSFDDTIVLKGLDFAFEHRPGWVTGRNVSDIEVRNCVLWCDWGRTCEIGYETAAPEYYNICFEDCDLIHNASVALDIQNGNYADVHDVVFRNLRVEYRSDALPEIYQESDDMVYDPQGRIGVPIVIGSLNHRFFPGDANFGSTHDVRFEDIRILTDPGFREKIPIVIANDSGEADFSNHVIRNLTLNGNVVKADSEAIRCEVSGPNCTLLWE